MTNYSHTKRMSLLAKTLCQFAVCASLCFALTAPLFYLLTKHYYAEDLAELEEAVRQYEGMPSVDLEEDVMAGMMLQFVLIFMVLTVSLLITFRFATKRLWKPFDDTLKKVEQFNLAQNDVPAFTDTDIQEFASLNSSLDTLMRKDKETYRIQKEFTENASHELQTPLAIIRSKLDLLMQENLGEREMKLVSDIYQMTMRLGHLNNNLLLLAKVENSQYYTLQDVNVGSAIAESLPLYEALLEEPSLRFSDLRADKTATQKSNPVLLECMLKNLIVNAIRHSAHGKEISVTLSDNDLVIGNASSDTKPLDCTTLFQRFRTSGDGRHKGNGLGLAIVKAICDFHHWAIDYRMEDNRHLFTIAFRPCRGAGAR